MRRHAFAAVLIAAVLIVAVSIGASSVSRPPARPMRSVLPSAASAQEMLNSTTRHREWVNVATARSPLMAFVVYPERSDKAPTVLLAVANEAPTIHVRAIADQLAAEGFIAVVPDVPTEAGYEASRRFADHLPAANGTSVRLNLNPRQKQVSVVADGQGVARFNATPAEWPRVVEYLSRVTNNRPTFISAPPPAAPDEHTMHRHMGHPPALAAQTRTGGATGSRTIPGLADKPRNLPASYHTATETLARSSLKKEWVDIPVGTAKLRTWVEYPSGNGKAGVVIVMQHGLGLDDWTRSVADQLASDGFIAVAPDAWSGAGPNGGNRDSFTFDDEAIAAGQRTVSPDEHQRRYKAAREWALALPRANGKSGSIGFCYGGTHSFRFAAEVPELNAAVVFYGGGPAEDLLAKINAPVLGFYGENDARVTATVAPTTEAMKRLGKSYESHVYPKVTHSFLYFQDLSVNKEAVADAWPRTIAFLNRQLREK